MLGLPISLPPVTLRELEGEPGAVQIWIETRLDGALGRRQGGSYES